MKKPLSIATKIWLSLSILIFGYFVSTVVGFFLGQQTENRLHGVSENIYPGAKQSQIAEAAFDEQIKLYQDAVLLGEQSLFDTAKDKADQVDNALSAITELNGLDPNKINETKKILAEYRRFTSTAQTFYPRMSAIIDEISRQSIENADETEKKMNEKAFLLSQQIEDIRGKLSSFSQSFSNDLNAELFSISSISVRQRYINIILFCTVLIIASSLITVLINRSIVRPLNKTFMLEKAVEQSIDGIVVADYDGYLLFVNNAWAKMHGYKSNELIGKHISCFYDTEQFIYNFSPFTEIAKLRGAHAGELNHKKKDGAMFPAMMTANTVTYNIKQPLRLVYIARDISEQKRNERDLRTAKEEAEIANVVKSEFLANMSHEIRTPMNGIIGMTKILLESDLNVEERECGELILHSADSLLSIINDILDFSKIEAGKIELEIINFDLMSTLEDTGELLSLKAHEKNLDFAYLMNSDVPEMLKGDKGRLRQILVNLTDNAIKFTEKGNVIIRVTKESETGTHVTLKFLVSDTGIGIASDQQRRLFKSFSQVDSSTTRKYGGTGLGLVISKQLVELMNGTIGVKSEKDKGSTFWFTAMLEKQTAGIMLHPALPSDIRRKRVLIITGDALTLEMLSTYLKKGGFNHQATSDVKEAVLQLRRAAEGDPFHLCIIDTAINFDDNAFIIADFKNDPALNKTEYIALLSQNIHSEGPKIKDFGYSAYLTKPVKRSQLFSCILAVFNKTNTVKTDSDQMTEQACLPLVSTDIDRGKTHILLVEDNIVNQKLVIRLIEKFGFEVFTVNNGKEAIRALENESYDIVLMDIQMPEMDGVEATKIIRNPDSNVTNHNIPIIAMTAHAMKGDRERFLSVGMDDYISKPILPQHLLECIQKYT